MKKVFFSHLILFSLLLLANPQLLLAQQNTQQTNTPTNNDVPPSFKYKLKKKVPVVRADFPEKSVVRINQYLAEEKKKGNTHGPLPVYDFLQKINFMDVAVCEKLPNGGKVYLLQIKSNGNINGVYFDKIDIPKNAELYWYAKKGGEYRTKQYISSYNKSIGQDTETDCLFIEYYQPPKTITKPQIVIANIDLHWKIALQQSREEQEQQGFICNPDVRCNIDAPFTNGTETIIPNSPIPNFKKNKIANAIVKFRFYKPNGCISSFEDSWEGSGAFINNLAIDGSDYYILTALHNFGGCYTEGENIPIHIRFRYENIGCNINTEDLTVSRQIPQASGVANALNAYIAAVDVDSDLALLKVAQNQIPKDIAIYLAGWDATSVIPNVGLGIHHPSGAKKCIAIENDNGNTNNGGIITYDNNVPTSYTMQELRNVVNSNPDLYDQYHHFFALNFDVGAPYTGSSGSPFFDTNGHIIGAVHGGSEICGDAPYNTYRSEYGNFKFAYSDNFQYILDPDNFLGGSMDGVPYADLYLRDSNSGQDFGIEPNQDGDIWASPDLWNRNEEFYSNFDLAPITHQEPEQDPTGQLQSTLLARINNYSQYQGSPEANLHLYYTIASTGEVWPDDWDENSANASTNFGDCPVGGELGVINIPENDIPNLTSKEYGFVWTPPSQDALEHCDVPYDPNTPSRFELCFLARLESAADPIQDELTGDESATKTNIIYSNNIATRNTFILPIPLVMQGSSIPTPTPIKYIFVKNADDFVKNLNITFEKISGEMDCTGEVYIDFLLSQELWDKWGSTGFKSEGITILAPNLVRITDCAAAKLLDIPFNPKERQPLGLKAELASGKQQNNIPIDFTFKISHESANPAIAIKPPTACLFKMGTTNGNNNNPNNIETAQLKVFPNPFTYDLTLQFALPKTENVTIGLYDMQGRLVQNILDAQQSEGVHTIYVNGRNLPAGMYLCKLMTPTTEMNKKIIKIK